MVDELELGTIGSPEATLEIDDTENEFVMRDSNDNIVARYDESAGQWVLPAVSTDQLNTPPTGAIVQLDSNQLVADNTFTTVDWGAETNRGTVSNLLSTNSVVIPDGFSYATVTWAVRWGTAVGFETARPLLNGDPFGTPGLSGTFASQQTVRELTGSTGWFGVSQNDEISFEVRQVSGSQQDIDASDRTYMEVIMI